MTEIEARRDWKPYYWRVWKALLAEFRGWSEKQVEAWAKSKGFLQGDESADDWIGHDPVATCVVNEITPAALQERVVGFAGVEMRRDMEDALWPGDYSWKWIEPEQADWPRIRTEVARVIAEWEMKVERRYEPAIGDFSGGVIDYQTPRLLKPDD